MILWAAFSYHTVFKLKNDVTASVNSYVLSCLLPAHGRAEEQTKIRLRAEEERGNENKILQLEARASDTSENNRHQERQMFHIWLNKPQNPRNPVALDNFIQRNQQKMKMDAEACWVAITFPVVVAGKEALPIPVCKWGQWQQRRQPWLMWWWRCRNDLFRGVFYPSHMSGQGSFTYLSWVTVGPRGRRKILWHPV